MIRFKIIGAFSWQSAEIPLFKLKEKKKSQLSQAAS